MIYNNNKKISYKWINRLCFLTENKLFQLEYFVSYELFSVICTKLFLSNEMKRKIFCVFSKIKTWDSII